MIIDVDIEILGILLYSFVRCSVAFSFWSPGVTSLGSRAAHSTGQPKDCKASCTKIAWGGHLLVLFKVGLGWWALDVFNGVFGVL